MTLKELKTSLKRLSNSKYGYDMEQNHSWADKLLLEYINDAKVTELFDKIDKYYA